MFLFGTKTHSYKLIFHPQIEEDQIKQVCFTNINLIEKIEKIEVEDFCPYNGAPL